MTDNEGRRGAMRELFIDCFAGGGGASIGVEQATGRSPDIAINHDPVALAMHAINHPMTLHLCTNIWKTDPDDIKGPIGGMWFSPDCTDHSKAKGGKPIRKHIRDLAWVVVRWLDRAEGGPRMFWLENVEEFQGWGPLIETQPGVYVRCPDRIGQTFKRFVRECRRRGYAIEWREIRGCNYGTPTTRKRLFMIARNDGEPIVWPKETHAKPGTLPVTSGHAKPWRLAADCIDWERPCPSIFETSAEIKEKFGIRANRPLAANTMARIARGIRRYVLEAADPFIVPCTHTGDSRTHGIDEPLPTTTCAHRGEHALVEPFLVRTAHGEVGADGHRRGQGEHPLDEPLGTVLQTRDHALVTPFITKFRQNATGTRMDEPLHTITANGHQEGGRDGCAATHALVAPVMVGVGSRAAQSPPRPMDAPAPTITATKRGMHAIVAPVLSRDFGNSAGASVDEPVPTVMPGGGGKVALVAPTLIQSGYGERPGQAPRSLDIQAPLGTVVDGQKHAVVSAFLAAHYGEGEGGLNRAARPDEPVRTITCEPRHSVVAAFLAQQNTGMVGHDPRKPMSTIVEKGSTQTVVSAGLINLKGSDRRQSSIEEPTPTQCARGWHIGEVRAFLAKYYSEGGQDQGLAEPLDCVTPKGRFGIVTVKGQDYQIVDIGMRMLTPRELFRANGAPDSYIIERGIAVCDDEDRGWTKGDLVPITKTQQISCCGNMVNPQVACALIAANYVEREIAPRGAAPLDLFAAAEGA